MISMAVVPVALRECRATHRSLYDIHVYCCLFSRFCGEGAPDWAVLPFLNESAGFPVPIAPKPYNLTSSGYPSREDCLSKGFALYYVSEAVGTAFQDFYDNTHGMQDAFAAYWTTVAKHFANNPYVLSYELLNEVSTAAPSPWGCGGSSVLLFHVVVRPSGDRWVSDTSS